MYRRILVALDTTSADEALLPHVQELARTCGAELVLLHVADGWVARHFSSKVLEPAESEEMKADREYLESAAARIATAGVKVTVMLALGDPPDEIVRVAEGENCDLIAMTTHGHRFLGDLVHGSTITTVRHRSRMPILLVRAKQS
jgi:manganese transport protein